MVDEATQDGWDLTGRAVAQEVAAWRPAHLRATLTEIEVAVEAAVSRLQGRLVEELADGAGADLAAKRPTCAGCGRPMVRLGRHKREVLLARQATPLPLDREYWGARPAGRVFFPAVVIVASGGVSHSGPAGFEVREVALRVQVEATHLGLALLDGAQFVAAGPADARWHSRQLVEQVGFRHRAGGIRGKSPDPHDEGVGAALAGFELAVELLHGVIGAGQTGHIVTVIEVVAQRAQDQADVVCFRTQPGWRLLVGVALRQGIQRGLHRLPHRRPPRRRQPRNSGRGPA